MEKNKNIFIHQNIVFDKFINSLFSSNKPDKEEEDKEKDKDKELPQIPWGKDDEPPLFI